MQVTSRKFDDFHRHYQPFVAAFVGRRVPVDAVPDIVAEVFAIAWKRRRIVPDDALPWLYRTARNVVGTHYRSTERLAALRTKLLSVPTEAASDAAEVATSRAVLVAAFTALEDEDRELLLLVAWEGLANAEAASALGLSRNAASVRLHRARTRFEQALTDLPYQAEHEGRPS